MHESVQDVEQMVNAQHNLNSDLKDISDVSAKEKKTLKCGGAITVWFRVFCLDTKT